MGKSTAISLCAVSTAALLLTAPEAFSQVSESGELQEVIVTAQKREETLQRAAVTVDVVSADEFARSGIKNAIDLQELVPAVRFVAASEMTVLIRGLGTVNINPGVDAAVAYAQDGVYLAHPPALTPVLYDLERVEVLLGPQGTLYGRNSNAGVVNFISKRPGPEFGGYARIGAGNYSAFSTEGALNVPLGETWALRVAVGSEKHGGYAGDGSNDVDALAGRAKLAWNPSDNISALLTLDAAKRDSKGMTYASICPPGNVAPGCTGVAWKPWQGLLPASRTANNENRNSAISLDLDAGLEWADLKSITGYREYKADILLTAPWYSGSSPLNFLQSDHSYFFTQEVRLSSTADSAVKWVLGAYYSHESQPGSTQIQYFDTLLQGFGLPPGFYQSFAVVDSDYTSSALFADVTVPLGDRFRFRGGLRYTDETKKSLGAVDSGIVNGPLFGPTQNSVGRHEQSRFTWKAGLDFDVTESSLLYFTASTGFKSGGVNNLPAATGILEYDPERVTAYEVGWKNRLLDNRLQLNLSAFNYDYRGFQTFTFYQPTGGPFAGVTMFPTVNSQTARFRGGEAQLLWAITPADTLDLSANFLDNKYKRFVINLPFFPVQDLSGTDVPLSPASQLLLGYEHRFNLGNAGTLSVGGNVQFVASHVVSGNQGAAAGAAAYEQPSYHKTGVNLTYRSREGGWEVSAFARNLENEWSINTVAGGYPVAQNVAQVVTMVDAPRTYGISLRKEF